MRIETAFDFKFICHPALIGMRSRPLPKSICAEHKAFNRREQDNEAREAGRGGALE
jgi:hypothetical protein